ncbi:STAS domain-containing protein [Leptospira interrogans]|uniref:STAS domain-containing protein n=1 Tax=Leptospira interrogans serovar Pomona TaxID=44276 RepID=A0AA41BHZ6_LEPIR|nr:MULTISPECIES: STAS domain-containing protein [Leptospira]ASV05658.1 anti-sigma factor antagonist [Leptospira interrogans serovar Canicola]ASV09044.1 anti-sigma factor antagonist [Leptospira interrogans serovar Canicola]EJO79647.1 STAS domain protein [Leptospira interrogans serovar Pomona str. Kennewicki LC82-25]EKN95844.1 STAS domain protein [Leptospira interrogans serovar Pomona str. Pomona]EKO68610.1 STAS domain protein [Leptospira interrogans serovar Canicola str. Fiocruz LV133]
MSFSLYTDFQESEVPVLKVKIEDELTIYEASQFKEKIDLILQNSATVLEIDLLKIQKIDTSCLQILLSFKKVALTKYEQVRFVNFSNNVLSLIDLYNLSDFFRDSIRPSKEEVPEGEVKY